MKITLKVKTYHPWPSWELLKNDAKYFGFNINDAWDVIFFGGKKQTAVKIANRLKIRSVV